MLAWVLRLLLLLLLGYLLYNLGRHLMRAVFHESGRLNGTAEGEGDTETMVLDPECGNYIHPRDALSCKVSGRTYHFCSRECRDAFCGRHRN